MIKSAGFDLLDDIGEGALQSVEGHIQRSSSGGGQAGLAVGYHLAQLGRSFLILDAHERTGDSWRTRWDSLRLFTPAYLNALPGLDFPGSQSRCSTKDEMADYLEAYAAGFDLPIRRGLQVDSVTKINDRFVITAVIIISRPAMW